MLLDSDPLSPRQNPSLKKIMKIPRSMMGVKGVTLGGVLYMTGLYNMVGIWGDICYSGGWYDGYHISKDEIYQWTGDDWEEVGKVKMARPGLSMLSPPSE